MVKCVCCNEKFERRGEREYGVCDACIARRERVEKIVRDALEAADLRVRGFHSGTFQVTLSDGFDIEVDVSNVSRSELEDPA